MPDLQFGHRTFGFSIVKFVGYAAVAVFVEWVAATIDASLAHFFAEKVIVVFILAVPVVDDHLASLQR